MNLFSRICVAPLLLLLPIFSLPTVLVDAQVEPGRKNGLRVGKHQKEKKNRRELKKQRRKNRALREKLIERSVNPEECAASFLQEYSTGEVLHSENAETPLPPASMVKLMVAYITLKKVQEGEVSLSDQITVSREASKIGGSQVYLKEGETFSVGDLLDTVLIQSANDSAYAIAEHIGGSVPGFVALMNEYASKTGLQESLFHTPHGLPPGRAVEGVFQQPDMVSARDFATLSRALISEFPEILERTSVKEQGFRDGEFIMRSHNKLLWSSLPFDGLKTGYYSKAGFNVTATAKKDGVRLVGVVMGCPQRRLRDAKALELFIKGFSSFANKTFTREEISAGVQVAVKDGELTSIPLMAAQDLSGIVSKKDNGLSRLAVIKEPCEILHAPVEAGVECGTVSLIQGDKIIAVSPYLTQNGTGKIGMFAKVKRAVGSYLK